MSLEFERLPLVEVRARFTLRDPLPLSAPFIIDLYELLKSEFPEISDPSELETPPGTSRLDAELGAAPNAVAFGNAEKEMILSVQRTLLGVRWVTSVAPDALDESVRRYPRFSGGLLPSLILLRDKVVALVGDEAVRPRVSNMVYTNFIVSDEPLKGLAVAELLNHVISDPMSGAERFHETNLSWRSSEGIDLRINVGAGQAGLQESRESGYVVKTSGGEDYENPAEAIPSLERVHEALCNMFRNLLTETAKERWGLKA